jgi:hypothetical protein
MIVLHIRWIDGGAAHEETYGPWTVDSDLVYLEQIGEFIHEWHARTGCQAVSVMMALVQDPAGWLAAPPGQPAT